jgi:hypothetical protein
MPVVGQCLTCDSFNKGSGCCCNTEILKFKKYLSLSCVRYSPNKLDIEDLLDAISSNLTV